MSPLFRAGSVGLFPADVRAGAGGDAFSTARATRHFGEIAARSTGGNGGTASQNAHGGNGGHATSQAFVGSGTSRFNDRAIAAATGGNGAAASGAGYSGGRGGDAYAEANGFRAAQVSARGGDGGGAAAGLGGVGGNATAVVNANAPTGNLSAIASAQVGAGSAGSNDGMGSASAQSVGGGNLLSRAVVDRFEGVLTARSNVAVSQGIDGLRTATTFTATRGDAAMSALAASGNVVVQSAIHPTDQSIRDRLDAGNLRVRHDLDPGGSSDVFAHASLAASAPAQLGANRFESFSSLGISIDANALATPRDLVVGFLDPIFSGNASASVLGIRITGFSSQPLLDVTLTPEGLLTEFDDRTLDLGALMGFANFNGEVALTVELRFTTNDPTARVALDLLVANTTLGSGLPIPEPSTALLLALGLVGLASKGSRFES